MFPKHMSYWYLGDNCLSLMLVCVIGIHVGAERHGTVEWCIPNCINNGNTTAWVEERKKDVYAIIDAVVSTELFVVVYSIPIGCLSEMSSKQYFT